MDAVAQCQIGEIPLVRRGCPRDEDAAKIGAVVQVTSEEDRVDGGTADVESRDGAQDADRRSVTHLRPSITVANSLSR